MSDNEYKTSVSFVAQISRELGAVSASLQETKGSVDNLRHEMHSEFRDMKDQHSLLWNKFERLAEANETRIRTLEDTHLVIKTKATTIALVVSLIIGAITFGVTIWTKVGAPRQESKTTAYQLGTYSTVSE